MAKDYGLKGIRHVSDLSGVKANTLQNWHTHKPALFRVVLLGCKEDYDRELSMGKGRAAT